MTKLLSWTIRGSGDAQLIELVGDIAERSNLDELAGELAPGTVTFDLAGIARINSGGVREWLRFVEKLIAKGLTIELTRCSTAFVQQLNMILNFGGGRVRSILAPYFCSTCNCEAHKLVELGRDLAPQLATPMPCTVCGEPMPFDDVEDHYFAFVRGSR